MLILLVEDDTMVREAIALTLVHEGHSVVETNTGNHALHLLQTGTLVPDLILTDVVMPGLPITDFVHGILTVDPAAKILLMTGYASDPLPGVPYLTKPFTGTALAAAVELARH